MSNVQMSDPNSFVTLNTASSTTSATTSTVTGEKGEKNQNAALVLESFEIEDLLKPGNKTDTYGQFVKGKDLLGRPTPGLFEKMGYTVTFKPNATVEEMLTEAPGKQIGYLLSHGVYPTMPGTHILQDVPAGWFQGLKFIDGFITTTKLFPLKLDYRLVLVDACCSAQTVLPDGTRPTTAEDAASSTTPYSNSQAFANMFGSNAAYVGWAWTVSPENSQPLMAELAQNLIFDKKLGRARTVTQAYAKLIDDNVKAPKSKKTDLSVMKLWGQTNHTIDLREGK